MNDRIEVLRGKLNIAENNILISEDYLQIKRSRDNQVKYNKINLETIHNLDRKNESLTRVIEKETVSIYVYESEIKKRDIKIKELELSINNNTQKHNSRSAGRKSKITTDIISQVKRLKGDGKSLGEIANLLTTQTGESFSKSTVKKIVDHHITPIVLKLN